MTRSVYHTGKQYSTVEMLRIAVLECWHDLHSDFLRHLLSSMQACCFQIIQQKSEET